MTCHSPVSGWYSSELNPSGKRSIVFQPQKAFTDLGSVDLPCGKCVGCRADQALMWSIRAYHESLEHDQNCFVTLTYDDEHLPHDGKISKPTLQKFFKRLRKRVSPLKLRYIACGEYGEQTRRPHYHAIFFGTDFLHDKITISDTLYTSPTLESAWGLGNVSVAPVTMASICYTCGYVVKKMQDEDTFMLPSKHPGIGKKFLDKFKKEMMNNQKVIIEGREFPIPQRYLQWEEESFKDVKKARAKHMKKYARDVDPVERARRSRAKEINRKSSLKRRSEKL